MTTTMKEIEDTISKKKQSFKKMFCYNGTMIRSLKIGFRCIHSEAC